MKNRQFEHEVLHEIQNRWSPRAFDHNKQVSDEDLYALIEAARYAPSCFNEQPWRYILGNTPEKRDKILSALNAGNQEWAANAPVLMVLLSKQNFTQSEKFNRWHQFDTGTAWGFLQLEAQKRGLITHAMGGFSVSAIQASFSLDDTFSVMAVVAIGYYGSPDTLSEKNKEKEFPSPRKNISELIL